jgi:putative acetyltransferase
MKEAVRLGATTVLVYGDPDYYARFGFKAEAAKRFLPPYALQYPAGWQGIDLGEHRSRGESVAFTCVGPLNSPGLW